MKTRIQFGQASRVVAIVMTSRRDGETVVIKDMAQNRDQLGKVVRQQRRRQLQRPANRRDGR